jgi:hypothetical protein
VVTPADQFAEAMQEVVSDIWNGERPSTTVLRTLARAFADRECEVEFGPLHSALVAHSEHVAAFFKRCGLEGNDGR